MHGITDGPPHTYSARQIGQAFVNAHHAQPNCDGYRIGDGSIVDLYCTIDLDYRMAYLLRVQPPNHSDPDARLDHLAVYCRHGGPDNVVAAEWWQRPMRFFDQTLDIAEEAHQWFVAWAFAEDRKER